MPEIVLHPSNEQLDEWRKAAGDTALETWLEDLGDAASFTRPTTWPIVIKLQHPIDVGSEHIEQIEFRRGCMNDLKGMSLDGVPTADECLLLASRMCGKTVGALGKLCDEDGAEVMAVAMNFFAACLLGGRKRSR